MKVGVHLGYQNLHGINDQEFFRRETQIAIEAEAMGFDFAAMVEHHFTDYAACPDPLQALSYVAAKTKTIKLMPAAVISRQAVTMDCRNARSSRLLIASCSLCQNNIP